MAIDLSDEILQDFLVEAGEILETLGEQLVELEQRPDDQNLLNAVFRGFHTVKGGGGFLNLTTLVEVCHRAEDVFNLLRQGERQVNAQLMDVILKVTDIVNEMMDCVRSGEDPDPADPAVLEALDAIIRGDDVIAEPSSASTPSVSDQDNAHPPEVGMASDGKDEINDDDFEALLDQLQGKVEQTPAPVSSANKSVDTSDDISDEDFEALLDQINSKNETSPTVAAPVAAKKSVAKDEISDDEFEALLDDINAGKKSEGVASTASKPAVIVDKPSDSAPKKPSQNKVELPKKVAEKSAKPVAEHNQDIKVAKEAAAVAETTVRVDTKRLDDIMNLVGELVLVRNRMSTLKTTMAADDEVSKAIANLDIVTSDLQASVMKTRMQPIKKVFGRFPRVVRDLARSLKKEVNLELIGEETDLDKNLVEALADPLVHLIRNAVDHGIEMPDEREQSGKPRAGTVILSAQQEGDHILLVIDDDGKGMDPNVLRQKAVEKGMMDEDSAARLDDRSCYNLIFAPGFSTKTEISDVSGRGVGMDVVKTRINQLNGSVEIDSLLGRGSRIVIKLPLTLAIMPTLMVVLGKQIFALPLANVNEIFDMDSAKRGTVDGKDVVIIRDKAVPLVNLSRWLAKDYAGPKSLDMDQGYVVVTTIGNKNIGCVVDNLVGQEEVVIKPLGAMLQGTKGISGATITGNGGIALILDMPGLLEAYANKL
ncbi:MAG: chemotaxis protein CheA [Pseudomonadota bacterium]|nr:chemotaxis protein CheA [Pseudomonadota bacterium]